MTHLQNAIYDHYISHCRNGQCKACKDCYRYLAYLELVQLHLERMPYTCLELTGTMDRCLAFMPKKEDDL